MRVKRSRPNWSVPIGCSQLGPFNRSDISISSGSPGASTGAKMAARTTTAMMPPPIIADLLRQRRDRRSRTPLPLPVTDLGIDPGVEDVHDQVHQRKEEGKDQHGALNEGEIALPDRGDHQATDTGPGED